MVTQTEKPVSQRARRGADSGKVLVQLTSDDFSRNDDGSWTVVRDVFITGSTESQLLIKEGKVFKKAEMMLFGMDLAAILERHRQP